MDFETRSKVNVGDVGAPKYSDDPSTVPLMLAYGNENRQEQWVYDLSQPGPTAIRPACPTDLAKLIEDPEVEFHAHNAGFEIAIWQGICHRRWGWPNIPYHRWHCTAAVAATSNHPRALKKLGHRLGVKEDVKKDEKGKELIDLLCTPTKAEKTYRKRVKKEDGELAYDENGKPVWSINKKSLQYLDEQSIEVFKLTNDEGKTYEYYFHEDPIAMQEFLDYNRQDIIAEMQVHKRLPKAHKQERDVWLLDLEVNRRGIPVDIDLCRGAMQVYETEVNNAYAAVDNLTDGVITKTTQTIRISKWVNERVNFGKSIAEDPVTNWLALNPKKKGESREISEVRQILELRQLAGGTAVAKYKKTLQYVQLDERVRDQLLYYGATTTGRWSGKGLQPHNFKRVKTLDEVFINAIKTGDHATVETIAAIEGMTVFDVLKGCLRGIICARPGYKLIFSDFAGIESRVLNWLCGNDVKLELYRQDQDAYIHTALSVYKCDYEDIAFWSDEENKWKIQSDHSEKRQIGKACELGLGYGMGWTTFQLNAAKDGSHLDEAFACEVVNTWRSENCEVVQFWYRLEKACKHVIWNKSESARVGPLRVFWDHRGYLCIQLPSGRCLKYFKASVHKDRAPDAKDDRPQIYYLDGGKHGHPANGGKISTYSGKLVENVVQAIARDLLVNSMLILWGQKVPIIFHVHDETVAEVKEDDDRTFSIIHQAMETLPDWARGLPLAAETQESRRFTK